MNTVTLLTVNIQLLFFTSLVGSSVLCYVDAYQNTSWDRKQGTRTHHLQGQSPGRDASFPPMLRASPLHESWTDPYSTLGAHQSAKPRSLEVAQRDVRALIKHSQRAFRLKYPKAHTGRIAETRRSSGPCGRTRERVDALTRRRSLGVHMWLLLSATISF